MKRISIIFVLALMLFASNVMAAFPLVNTQDDTIKAQQVSMSPIVNGMADDVCWQNASWQLIDQVWIPYGDSVAATDFTGKFKVVWSSSENLLYFLVEIIDDVFVDGYVYNSDPNIGKGYPDHDIVEVFLDEDKSGGMHVFDGNNSSWGKNAENAFAYHIAINAPQNGDTTTQCVVCDIAGTSWSNYEIPNYASHLPEFAVRKSDSLFTWEFSMAVFNDTFEKNNPKASRVKLESGKIMGLSLAYCDNDNPNEIPKKRDSFFGSVWVPEAAYNDHWKDASGFGTIELVSQATPVRQGRNTIPGDFQLYPNPSSGDLHFAVIDDYFGDLKIKIFNLLGQQVYGSKLNKMSQNLQTNINLNTLPDGVYFLAAETSKDRFVTKMCKVNK